MLYVGATAHRCERDEPIIQKHLRSPTSVKKKIHLIKINDSIIRDCITYIYTVYIYDDSSEIYVYGYFLGYIYCMYIYIIYIQYIYIYIYDNSTEIYVYGSFLYIYI